MQEMETDKTFPALDHVSRTSILMQQHYVMDPTLVITGTEAIIAHGYGDETTSIQVVVPSVRARILILLFIASQRPIRHVQVNGEVLGLDTVSLRLAQINQNSIRILFSFFCSFQFSRHSTAGGAVDLGKSGSCLRYHESNPFLECRSSNCYRITGDDKSYWLSTRYFDEGPRHSSNRYGTISRCRVCYK